MENQRSATKKKDKGDKSNYRYLLPPWPQWNDNEVNAEKWDVGSNFASKSKERQKVTPTGSASGFVNPLGHGELPTTFKVSAWVRPSEYKPDTVFTVFDGKVEPNTDLVTPNLHLLRSRIMRAIISSISNLLRLAFKKPFPVEFESSTFVPTGDKIWQPWHHVYSYCKAGKGQYHNPIVNTYGKYIVRLYYMDAWRGITVDDYIPLDGNGSLLLPNTGTGKELWFIILSKAILSVAALSWTDESEMIDFNVTTCLTGWLNCKVNCREMPFKYIWPICQKLLMPDHEDECLRYTGVIKEETTNNYCFNVTPRVDNTHDHSTLDEHEILGSVVIFGNLNESSDSSNMIDGLTPCHEHLIMITEAKKIKYNYDPNRPPTPLWKKFRWKAWALRNGIIKYEPMYELKCIRVFSSLKNVTSRSDTQIVPSTESTENEIKDKESEIEIDTKEQEKSNKKGNKKGKSPKNETSTKTPKSEKSSKQSQDKRGKTPKINLVKLEETPEEHDSIEPWFDFEKVIPALSHLEVFYRPSCFVNSLIITDVKQLTTKEKQSPGKRQQRKEPEVDTNIRKCKNDSFYLFTDSAYCKKIFISLSALPDCTFSKYLDRIKLFSSEDNIEVKNDLILKKQNIRYHISGEEYNWKYTEIGNEVFTLSSNGTNSVMLQFNEGIKVIKIWLKVPDNYSLQILSQIPFMACGLQEVQDQLSLYSSSLNYYGEEMLNSFLDLYKMDREVEEYPERLEQFKRKYMPNCLLNPKIKPRDDITNIIDTTFEDALLIILQEKISDLERLRNVILDLKDILKFPSFGQDLIEEIERKVVASILPEKTISSVERDKTVSKQDTKSETKSKKSSKQTAKKPSKNKSLTSNAENSAAFYFNTADEFIKVLFKMFELDNNLIKYYPFKTDLNMKLVYNEYNGREQSQLGQDWLPLVRFVVNFHSQTPVLSAFNFESSHPRNTFRVINNDTLQEMPHNLMGVAPEYYIRNNKGYTLLGYGYLKDIQLIDFTWKLRILAEKPEHLPYLFLQDDENYVKTLQPSKLHLTGVNGFYIPNKDNNICRCILKSINKKFATLRLALSNIMVEFVLKIKKKSNEDITTEFNGRGEIIIPVLELYTDQEDELEKTVEFEIEVYVRKINGWPITSEEKSEINAIKQRTYRASSVSYEAQKSASKLKSGRKSISEKTSDKSVDVISNAPSWKLQVLTDVDNGQVELQIDVTELEMIRKMKAAWEAEDPGRRERAAKIREQYLLQCGDSSTSLINSSIERKSLYTTEDILLPIFSEYFCEKLRPNHYILLQDCLMDKEEKRQKEIEDFIETNNFFNERRKDFLQDQSMRHKLLVTNLDNERHISSEIINSCYEMREEYIQSELTLRQEIKTKIEEAKKELKREQKKINEDPKDKDKKKEKTKQPKSKKNKM